VWRVSHDNISKDKKTVLKCHIQANYEVKLSTYKQESKIIPDTTLVNLTIINNYDFPERSTVIPPLPLLPSSIFKHRVLHSPLTLILPVLTNRPVAMMVTVLTICLNRACLNCNTNNVEVMLRF
jgi:hypothetical protein